MRDATRDDHTAKLIIARCFEPVSYVPTVMSTWFAMA